MRSGLGRERTRPAPESTRADWSPGFRDSLLLFQGYVPRNSGFGFRDCISRISGFGAGQDPARSGKRFRIWVPGFGNRVWEFGIRVWAFQIRDGGSIPIGEKSWTTIDEGLLQI
jgi:hypothetical protein